MEVSYFKEKTEIQEIVITPIFTNVPNVFKTLHERLKKLKKTCNLRSGITLNYLHALIEATI